MTYTEALEKLKADPQLYGEWSLESGVIHWYNTIQSTEDNDDDQDRMWNMYCEVAERVRGILGDEFEIIDSWSDNDSQGFYVVRK
jgi:hypothetical protein